MPLPFLMTSRLPRFLFENALHDAGTNAERSADFEDAISTGPQLQCSRLRRRLDPTAPQFDAVRSGARQPSIYPFSNDPSLELGKHAVCPFGEDKPNRMPIANPKYLRVYRMAAIRSFSKLRDVDRAIAMPALPIEETSPLMSNQGLKEWPT
jgi:hypothetical protein